MENYAKQTFTSFIVKTLNIKWLKFWALLSSILALLWLILRSGSKPSRLTYPCQQAAFSTASITLGIPIAAILVELKRRILLVTWKSSKYLLVFMCIIIIGLGFSLIPLNCGTGSDDDDDNNNNDLPEPPPEYRAHIYHVTTCQEDPVNERFAGLDRLINILGRDGHKFYNSDNEDRVSGPEGIIRSDDIVIIKINYQWPERGGTNTDLLRGLIWSIITHPDTFTGEIVIGENTQSVASLNFNRSRNNAADQHQSPRDVVSDFQALGYTISISDWRQFRLTEVQEYSSGDMNNGYVVYSYNHEINGRISYPKFRTLHGTYISLRDGIWDTISGTYDRHKLKFINVPVLKGHSVYGTTCTVKNYMGVVTDSLNTRSHDAIQYGGLGAVMAEIHLADLNILDAIWVGAIPDHHPSFGYDESLRWDMLMASIDPVALDYWAVKNVLLPAFAAKGYSEPYTTADPDDPNSLFREYLDNSMNQLLDAGYDVTNNPDNIDTFAWTNGDFQGDGQVNQNDFTLFSNCFTGSNGDPIYYNCLAADFDCDYDVDCDDWQQFRNAWTGSGSPPTFDPCK